MSTTIDPIITPDILNILSSNHVPVQRVETESQPQPQPKPKRSLWSKFRGGIKKMAAGIKYVCGIVTTVAIALNAYTRYINATRSARG